MRKCPFCEGEILTENEPCIFCDGKGCRLCADNDGMTTIITCENNDCVLGDDEDGEAD